MSTFTVKTPYAVTPDCYLSVDRYASNDHIAISIWSATEGPFADLTVNLDDTDRYGRNCAFLDTNNFPGGPALVQLLGIGKETGDYASSGFCTYPLYEFDEEALKKWGEVL